MTGLEFFVAVVGLLIGAWLAVDSWFEHRKFKRCLADLGRTVPYEPETERTGPNPYATGALPEVSFASEVMQL